MGAVQPTSSQSMFAPTRMKLFILASLAAVWCIAYLMPNYSPAIQRHFKSRLDEARKKIPSIKVDWHRPVNPQDAFDSRKVALMIEPRPLHTLVPQILHMITVVPPEWRFVFIGSNTSILHVGRATSIKHQQIIGKMDLMVMPEPWEIDTKEKTYRMLTDLRFYDEFLPGVEHIFKYEYDSILCANSEKSLNEFLEWSWTGAPRNPKDHFAGNGGLSLRKVAAIRRVLQFQARYNDSQPEDEWFGKRLWVLPGEKVAAGLNGALAVENTYIKDPMGYHIRDGNQLPDEVWKDEKRRKEIFKYCPELSLIMDMKLERQRCDGDRRDGTIDESARKKAEEERKEREEADRKKKEEEERKKKEESEKKKAEEEARKKAIEEAHDPQARRADR